MSQALIPITRQADTDIQCIELWLKSKRSDHTRRAYAHDASQCLSTIGKTLDAITLHDLQTWADSLAGRSEASQARSLNSIKSLFAFSHRIGYVQWDVAAVLSVPVPRDTLAQRILGEDACKMMIANEPNARNVLILRVLYGLGLRISEVAGLCWSDAVSVGDHGALTVRGKGAKDRVVMVPHGLWDALQTLRGGCAAIFVSQRGGHLDPSQIHRIVKDAAERCELSTAVSAHWLRHSHVSHALDHGAPVHLVRESVGHASLSTTTRYAHAKPSDGSSRFIDA